MRRKKTMHTPGHTPAPGSANLRRPAGKSPRLRADRQMLGEAFAAEALDGLSRQADERHLDANLDDLKQRLQLRIAQQKKRRDKWVLPFGLQPYVIAASVGLVLVCAVVVLFNTKYLEKTQVARRTKSQADETTAYKPMTGSAPYEIKGRPLPPTPRPVAVAPAPAGPAEAVANPPFGAQDDVAEADAVDKKADTMAAAPPAPVRGEPLLAAADRPEAKPAPGADRKVANAPARKTAADTPVLLEAATLAPVPAAQTTRTIRGRVVDAEDGLAIPGVRVAVRGTELAAQTDARGEYEITVPADAELAFSFIGYTTYRTPVGQHAILDARLTPDVKSLGEVVVTTAEGTALPFEPARPPGGKPEYVKQLAAKIASGLPDKHAPAIVKLSFTILPDGRPSAVKAYKSNCPPCDEAAAKAVEQGAMWTPARKNGIAVPHKVKLTVPLPAEKR